jgi:hypothetical protein
MATEKHSTDWALEQGVAQWQPLSTGVDLCTNKEWFVAETDKNPDPEWGPQHLTIEDFKPCHPHTEGLPVEVYMARTANYDYVLLHQLQYESFYKEPLSHANPTLVEHQLLRFKRKG